MEDKKSERLTGESPRPLSRMTVQALLLLGKQVQVARKQRKMTEQEMAARAGIARSTLRKIEAGDPGVAAGLVFEVCRVAGLPLFEEDKQNLPVQAKRLEAFLALLPQSIRHGRGEVKDDF